MNTVVLVLLLEWCIKYDMQLHFLSTSIYESAQKSQNSKRRLSIKYSHK